MQKINHQCSYELAKKSINPQKGGLCDYTNHVTISTHGAVQSQLSSVLLSFSTCIECNMGLEWYG